MLLLFSFAAQAEKALIIFGEVDVQELQAAAYPPETSTGLMANLSMEYINYS